MEARTSNRYNAAVPDRRSQKINFSGMRFVKLKMGEVIDFVTVLPVVETQLGDDRNVEVFMINPLTLQPVGNAGVVIPSKDSEYGKDTICASNDIEAQMSTNIAKKTKHFIGGASDFYYD
jgi:hypothetical protein